MTGIGVKPSTDVTALPVAVDPVGADRYQVIKVAHGADGSAIHSKDTDGFRFPVGGAQIGAVTETAPASDTASSGLNGRLQRVAQRLTTVIASLASILSQLTTGVKTTATEGVLTATVLATATESDAQDLTGIRNFGIMTDANFDGTTISFKMSDTLGGTYVPVYDITGTLISIPMGASRYQDVPGELMAVRFLKIVCGSTQNTTSTVFKIISRS